MRNCVFSIQGPRGLGRLLNFCSRMNRHSNVHYSIDIKLSVASLFLCVYESLPVCCLTICCVVVGMILTAYSEFEQVRIPERIVCVRLRLAFLLVVSPFQFLPIPTTFGRPSTKTCPKANQRILQGESQWPSPQQPSRKSGIIPSSVR